MIARDLSLHEEVLLLALHDDRGTVAFGSMCEYAIGGALLAELQRRGRIEIETVKRSDLVNVIDATPTGEPVLDECLERIRQGKRRASASAWITRFASFPRLKERIAERLCLEGVLRPATDQVLFVFSRKIYPTVSPEPEQQLVLRIGRAITGEREADQRTRSILALAHAGGLLQHVFDRAELRQHKQHIENLTREDVFGKATKSTIEAVHVAIMTST